MVYDFGDYGLRCRVFFGCLAEYGLELVCA